MVKAVEGQELLERQGQHPDFHISSGKQGGELCGQQIGIGACDVNIHIVIQPEGFNGLFPVAYRLQFVENQIGFSAIRDLLADIVVEGKIIGKRSVAQRLQIHMNNVRFRDALFQKILMVQFQQG